MSKLEVAFLVWAFISTFCFGLYFYKYTEVNKMLNAQMILLEAQHRELCILKGEDPSLPWDKENKK